MTKVRYFISILCAAFLPVIMLMIVNRDEIVAVHADEILPIVGVLAGLAISLFIFSFVLAAGMDFAERIGARLLLLQENYNVKKDILMPGLIAGIAVAAVLLMLRTRFHFELFADLETNADFYFYKRVVVLLSVIKYDVSTLLFWMAGCALFIKKLTRSAAMDAIMYVSIILISLLFNMGSPIWNFGLVAIPVGEAVRCGIDILLGVLFWKKGFETAVLCHLIITFIFYAAISVTLAIGV